MSRLYSIRTRLILLLTLVVTIVYAAFTLVEVRQKTARIDHEMHAQIDRIVDIQSETLATPLWNFDHGEVQRQMNLLTTYRDIISASVVDTTGAGVETTIAGATANIEPLDERADLESTIAHDAEHDFAVIRDIQHAGEPIGRLIVELSHDRIENTRRDALWAQARQFLILTAAVTLTIAVAVTGLVRPILDITQSMGKIADGNLDAAVPGTERRDEIGDMAQALTIFKANAVQLKIALEKERELNGLQRQFVSMVSHEFRTPLAIIDGCAQRLLRKRDALTDDLLTGRLGQVRLSVVRLTELMESVLDAARLEEGRIAFEPGPCALIDLIQELGSSYGELYGNRELILDIDRLPNAILGDHKLLRQAFSNLLSNAVKYSEAGSRIWINGCQDQQSQLVVTIRDEGVGIPREELQHLFDRFFRASTSTGIAGSGIGLHLVQHFVGLHDGSVEVESIVDAGTTFTVYLPFIDPATRGVAAAA